MLPQDPPSYVKTPEQHREWKNLAQDAVPIEDAEFYFGFNSGKLDRENYAAIQHHARQIASKYAGRTIIVGGYADEIGDISDCEKKALERANNVATILRRAGIDARPVGFGARPPDRGGAVTDPGARQRRRCVILYVSKPLEVGEKTTSPAP